MNARREGTGAGSITRGVGGGKSLHGYERFMRALLSKRRGPFVNR